MRRKTEEQFIKEMSENHPNLSVLSNYVNTRTKVNLKCNNCGYLFSATPGSLYMGHCCPKCGGSAKKTHEEFVNEMKIINDSVIIIGRYIGSKEKIDVLCKKCGHKWKSAPNVLLTGKGCIACSGTMPKTHETFIMEMKEKHPTIDVIGHYLNNREKVECKCQKCGKSFLGIPKSMIISGHDCPYCAMSHGERAIRNWLDNNNIGYEFEHIFNDCKDKWFLRFDFYIPSKLLVIEYDGKQHFEENEFFGGKTALEETQNVML